MKHVVLPSADQLKTNRLDLPFYLAMEEWVARNLNPSSDYFFMWQVEKTVIFGRNQLIDKEVDLDYCRQNDIATYRRKSGGGCVYADSNNLMLSYITSTKDDVATTFHRYTASVADLLRSFGLNAEASSRNDVTIDGRKVSGNAFYRIPGRSIAHGTMLFDSDFVHILHAITPSRSKLESKGVKSVESRVTTLHHYLPELTIDEFRKRAAQKMCDEGEVCLSAADVVEIEALAREYRDPAWIRGHHLRNSLARNRRFDGVGELHAEILMARDQTISRVDLTGDFFHADSLLPLLDALVGARLERPSLQHALRDVEPSAIIPSLSKDMLIDLLTEQ